MPPADRLYFLDNLRMLTVLAVLALHAGIAYAPIVPWWYVADAGKNAAFDLLLVVTDGFVMPTLFAIAGYFAEASLDRHGPAGFLSAKARRLGLPLIVVTLLLCPVISYVIYLGDGGTQSYWRHWLGLLPTVLDWRPRLFSRAADVVALQGHVWPYHLWFLALLLVLCLLLTLVRPIWRQFRGTRPRAPSRPGFGLFCLLALVAGLAEGLGQALFPDGVWGSLGPFFVVQIARVPLYLGMFGLGLFARHRGWCTTHRLPGRLWLWGLAVVAAFVAMAAGGAANMAPGVKSVWVPVCYGLGRTVFGLAATGALVVFGHRYWNRPGGRSARLAAASYDIYLAHLPLVVVLQYWLAKVAVSPFAKFAIVFLATLGSCYGASRLAARCRTIWVPAGTLAAFGLCLLIWR